MKAIFSIVFILTAYIILSYGVEYVKGWVCALVGSLLVVLAISICFLKPKVKNKGFPSTNKVGWLECLLLGGLGTLLLSLLFLFFWFGPSFAIQARDATLIGSGYGDDGGYGDGQGGETLDGNDAGLIVGNDEAPEIRIPSKGGPSFKPFPEVWVTPKDEESRAILAEVPLYLRLKYFDHFDGKGGWTSLDASSKFLEAKSGWIVTDDTPSIKSASYTVTHSSEYRLLHAVQGLERVKIDSLKGYGGVGFSIPLIDDGNEDEQRSYECVSSPRKFKDFSLADLKEIKLGKGYDSYAKNTFSNSLRIRLRELKENFDSTGISSPGEQVKVIQEFLKNQYRYSLDVKNISGKPPIENFLSFEKEGYCLHFSSAAVLLCREFGIPARLASGYCGGKYFPKNDTWVFYTNNAHSWLEVYLEGQGWVIVETTPPQGISAAQASRDEELGGFPNAEDRLESSSHEDFEPSEHLAAIYKEAQAVLIIIAILFGALLVISIYQKKEVRKRRRSNKNDDELYRFEERIYISLYRKMAQLNGLPMMDGDTLLMHVNLLEEKGAKPEFADELLNYHYNTAYREEDCNKSIERSLLKRIKKWKS